MAQAESLPPEIQPSTSQAKVEFNGIVIADSRRTIRVLEGSHPACWYFPPEDVRVEYLQREPHTTECPLKGTAHYYSISVDARTAELVAWCYAEPKPEFAAIKHYIAFYPGKVDRCTVDGQPVTPEPVEYYGGWTTEFDR